MNRQNDPARGPLFGPLILASAVFLWGSSFIVQSVSAEKLGPFSFNMARQLLGAAALLLLFLVLEGRRRKGLGPDGLRARRDATRKGILRGLLLGLFLCLASNLQQAAFDYSTAGKIAFITAGYMFIVPVLGLFLGKRLPWLTWVCVAVGFLGMFLLCVDPAELGELNRGDLLTLGCSVAYAVHILLIERFSQDSDGLLLSCVQFFCAGLISAVLAFVFETPGPGALRECFLPCLPYILYSGLLVCAVAYTCQIIGQKYTEATVASLIMCLEGVVAALLSAILLKERMLPREIAGAALMLAATAVSQTPHKKTA